MKKWLIFLLLATLTACDAPAKALDLQQEYSALTEAAELPQMLTLDKSAMESFCGIEQELVVQGVVCICADSLRTDEIWLLEAKDKQSLEKIKALADARLAQKAAESAGYSPEQYAVVRQAVMLERGRYFALLVSPNAAALRAALDW